jgi:outer membrane protein assembly factor BamB
VTARTKLAVSAVLAAFLSTAALSASGSAAPPDRLNWPMYLYGPTHSSANLQAAAVTPQNAGALRTVWHWHVPAPTEPGQPEGQLFASPIVFNGRVYVATNSGLLVALDEATGAVVWKRLVGWSDPVGHCPARGFAATPAVARDPVTHALTVYVAAGDGYLYAFGAVRGKERWRSLVASPADGDYNWSSPTVSSGYVYVGVSGSCVPDTVGGLRAFDQSTGALAGSFQSVPDGSFGGPIWSTAAAEGTDVWVTTGDAVDAPSSELAGDAYSFVRLEAGTLAREDAWRVTPDLWPTDLDFGASPTLFDADIGGSTQHLVGACNKNGVFYALEANNLAAGPVWTRTVGVTAGPQLNACMAGAVWDTASGRLFVAGNETTIDGTDYPGAIRELDPADGSPIWERGLSVGPTLGTPTLSGGSVLAVATYDKHSLTDNSVYLVDASTGQILRRIRTRTPTFAQPVFADGYLLVAASGGRLTALAP